MSTNLLAKAWEVNFKEIPCEEVSPTYLKMCFLKLCEQAHEEDGYCYVGYDRLAAFSSFSRESAISCIKELKRLGLIKVVIQRECEEKSHLSNKYQVNLKLLDHLSSLN